MNSSTSGGGNPQQSGKPPMNGKIARVEITLTVKEKCV